MELGLQFSLIQKTGEAGDQSCDPWIGSLACYPLHYCCSLVYAKQSFIVEAYNINHCISHDT